MCKLLAAGQSILEFTFETLKMRTIALNQKAAQKSLGDEVAEALHSLLADLGNAMYLNELIDPPAAVQQDPLILEHRLCSDYILQIQPIGVHAVDWAAAHRAKLVRIVQNGARLV